MMQNLVTSSILAASVAAANISAVSAAVTCAVNDHLVGPLAYFKEGQIQPCSYAGTLPSSIAKDHHMFYWMYPHADP
jgi:hypothetical protein